MKEYKIQVRTEVYETYVIKVDKEFGDSPVDDDEALEIALSKLDRAFTDSSGVPRVEGNYEVYIDNTFHDFGGFISIEEGMNGEFKRVLGEPFSRELPNKKDISKHEHEGRISQPGRRDEYKSQCIQIPKKFQKQR